MPAFFVMALTTRDSGTSKERISGWCHPAAPPRHDDGAFVVWLAAIDALVAGTRHRGCDGWSHDSRERVVQCACGARLWLVLVPAAATGPLREALR